LFGWLGGPVGCASEAMGKRQCGAGQCHRASDDAAGHPVPMAAAEAAEACRAIGKSAMSNVILEKVSRNFGDFSAVSNVDLRVDEGEFVTLLGPSGCGKTTTLRMVAGLEQNTGGRISIGGEIVSDAARGIFVPSERRRLGMVFQSYAIWPHMTVFENVA